MTAPHVRACVIGWPISHSRSPLIHKYWLEKYGIAGSYEKIAVQPEELECFLSRIAAGEFVGCNVTIPHKEAVFRLVTIEDELTRKLKSVNTVYVENGNLKGMSTDGQGFTQHLQTQFPAWSSHQKTVAVYGAGGAARSIIAQFLQEGVAEILLTNRTLSRATKIAEEFGARITTADQHSFETALKDTDLLVNTTPLGMSGQPTLQLDISELKTTAIVADIVYSPLRTELLVRAERRGYQTLDGLGMLLHQAVPGFEKWFGVHPDVTDELWRLIAADIQTNQG